MATLTRPRMGSRAISDMNPLMSPSPSCDKIDLGRGTQATSGGAKVTSCSRTALGGMAPLSPFLPLPPAISSEELHRRCSQDKAFLDVIVSKAANHVRFSSNVEGEAAGKKTRAAALSNAPHMIRCYSMPVATQRDYDVQREMFQRRQQWPGPMNGNNVASKAENFGANTMTSSKSSIGIPNSKHQLQSDAQQDHSQHLSNHRKLAKVSPRSPPRSALSIMTFNDTYARNDSNEVDMESGSDDAEALTPRALSPANNTNDYFTKANSAPPFDNLAFYIHPSHLQPPVGFTSS